MKKKHKPSPLANLPRPNFRVGSPGDFSAPQENIPFSAGYRTLMPPYKEIPEEFKRDESPWVRLQQQWFFSGLDTRSLNPKPGIDRNMAVRHLSVIQNDWGPPHEHKQAGVAYLMSLWFEEPRC